ncbi:hypothetical protein HY419_00255 [candidate division WWE3 bacterium]|nr:hypothetical protein [candidate division WWE3 bacterium]
MRVYLPKILIAFFVFTSVVSVFGRIYVSSKLATKGDEIRNLEEELAVLGKENDRFRRSIAEVSSLTEIKNKALALGMTEPSQREYITPLPEASAKPLETANF